MYFLQDFFAKQKSDSVHSSPGMLFSPISSMDSISTVPSDVKSSPPKSNRRLDYSDHRKAASPSPKPTTQFQPHPTLGSPPASSAAMVLDNQPAVAALSLSDTTKALAVPDHGRVQTVTTATACVVKKKTFAQYSAERQGTVLKSNTIETMQSVSSSLTVVMKAAADESLQNEAGLAQTPTPPENRTTYEYEVRLMGVVSSPKRSG